MITCTHNQKREYSLDPKPWWCLGSTCDESGQHSLFPKCSFNRNRKVGVVLHRDRLSAENGSICQEEAGGASGPAERGAGGGNVPAVNTTLMPHFTGRCHHRLLDGVVRELQMLSSLPYTHPHKHTHAHTHMYHHYFADLNTKMQKQQRFFHSCLVL